MNNQIKKDKKSIRSRHDFFYFLVATRYFLNYKHLFDDTFTDKVLDNANSWLKDLDEMKIKSFSDENLKEISLKNGMNDLVTKLFGLRTFGNITIVFSALCLESIINDYCVFRKSSTYFKNYIDRLDTPSKWLLVPKLMTNKEISAESETYQLIKELFILRNNLVHPKSKELDRDGTNQQDELKEFLINKVGRSYLTIKESVKTLYKIDSSFKHLEDYKFLWDKKGKFNNISDMYSFYSSMYSNIDVVM